jgi:hypothetical protein
MTTRTRTNRTSRKLNIDLESLESREVLTASYSGALQAALSQSQGLGPHANRFAAVQHALPLARPGAPLQGSAASLAGNSIPGVAPAAMMTNRRAALFAQMQTRRAALAAARAEATPRPWAARAALRIQAAAPTTPPGPTASPTTPTTPMTNDDTGSTAENLPANISGALKTVYQDFKNGKVPVSGAPGSVRVDGSNVGVSVHGNGQGDFSAFVGTLQTLGMEVSATDAVTWTVEGMLPIDQLPAAAQTPQTMSITPSSVPSLN